MDNSSGLYSCNKCNKTYTSYKSLWNHNKKFHFINKTKPILDQSQHNQKPIIDQSSHNQKPIIIPNTQCKYCNKIFSHYNNKWRHEKTCKNIVNNNQIINNNQIQNNHIQNINNGTINNQKHIIINQIGKESINCLPMKDILKILGDGNNMPITCIKKLNFNKNIPENHSFCTTTLEGKHFTRINHETCENNKCLCIYYFCILTLLFLL
jgi:hypothetical protein